MRSPPLPLFALVILGLFGALLPTAGGAEFDVLIYGASPAGISAALAAGRSGSRVLLVEPSSRIGGMLTQGISHPGFTSWESRSGRYLEFTTRVAAHYERQYGRDSVQLRDSLQGCFGEPGVNLAVLEALLAEVPKIEIQKLWSLEAVKCSTNAPQNQPDTDRSAEVAVFLDDSGARHPVAARCFIDATYEGDLLAAAGIPYRIGREGRSAFSEALAPESGDDQLQASNFQPVLTRLASNRVPIPAPAGYRKEDFSGILPLFRGRRLRRAFGSGRDAVFNTLYPGLPNGKQVLLDAPQSLVRLSLPGSNAGWPDGDGGVAIRNGVERDTLVAPFSRLGLAMPRERIRSEHRRWILGLLFFLQNDPSVPPEIREEVAVWGLPADEFLESAHFPEHLCVREARRMVARRIFTQRDTGPAENEVRSSFLGDSIAISDCSLSSHLTRIEASRFGGRVSGEFEVAVPPVQIPLGVLFPRHVDNLLSACAVGASHVGFCILHYEPVWMALGEAAGHVAHLACSARSNVPQVPAAEVQARLHATGSATLYISDVPPDHPDFPAVQWWGSIGGFHGLEPGNGSPGVRGARLPKGFGAPFFAAFPGHAAQPDTVLDPELARRWALVAQAAGIEARSLAKADGTLTRGAWIRAAFRLAQERPKKG